MERSCRPFAFDDAQIQAWQHPAPLVLSGSAGSGKTAVTLARLREAEGRVLYVALCTYLDFGAEQAPARWGTWRATPNDAS